MFTYATVLTGRTRRVALDISSLGKGLAKCQQLQNLKFDFAGCRELTDISSLCKGLAKCQQLQNLDFDFANCTKLKDISSLGEGVAKCRDWICDRAFRCHALFLDWEDASTFTGARLRTIGATNSGAAGSGGFRVTSSWRGPCGVEQHSREKDLPTGLLIGLSHPLMLFLRDSKGRLAR